MFDIAALIYLGLIKPDKEIIDAMKKHSEATNNLIKVIEENPQAFDRLISKIFCQNEPTNNR